MGRVDRPGVLCLEMDGEAHRGSSRKGGRPWRVTVAPTTTTWTRFGQSTRRNGLMVVLIFAFVIAALVLLSFMGQPVSRR